MKASYKVQVGGETFRPYFTRLAHQSERRCLRKCGPKVGVLAATVTGRGGTAAIDVGGEGCIGFAS